MEADDADELAEMVRELCELESGLSSWEVDFIEDMSHRETYTHKQADKIRAIYEEMFE